MVSNLDAALAYASHGWFVLPCHHMVGAECSCGKPLKSPKHSVGKHPATVDGYKSATTDAFKIREWWLTGDGDYNIAISTGHSQLLVLDFDPKNGGLGSLDRLISEHGDGFMQTLRCKTGSGGLHLYYRDTAGLPSTASLIASGVDTRGLAGYVLCPPSNHQSGGAYEWASGQDHTTEPLPVPEWLVEALRASKPVSGPAPPIPRRIGKGQRNGALLSLAGTLHRRSVPERAILACLSALNEDCCDPPVPESDLRYIIKCVSKYPAADDPPPRRTSKEDWWGVKW